MSVKTIPQSFVFVCDFCGTASQQESDALPKYWAYLKFTQDAYDWSGVAVADGSTESLLCTECKSKVQKVVEKLHSEIKQ